MVQQAHPLTIRHGSNWIGKNPFKEISVIARVGLGNAKRRHVDRAGTRFDAPLTSTFNIFVDNTQGWSKSIIPQTSTLSFMYVVLE